LAGVRWRGQRCEGWLHFCCVLSGFIISFHECPNRYVLQQHQPPHRETVEHLLSLLMDTSRLCGSWSVTLTGAWRSKLMVVIMIVVVVPTSRLCGSWSVTLTGAWRSKLMVVIMIVVVVPSRTISQRGDRYLAVTEFFFHHLDISITTVGWRIQGPIRPCRSHPVCQCDLPPPPSAGKAPAATKH